MGLFRKKKPLLPPEDQEKVVVCIQDAESKTTGELRVFLESRCAYVDAMDRARELFAGLRMHETERRNAVLVYMAIDDQQFAIMGDEEIYKQAGGPLFWHNAAEQFKAYLKEGKLADGLCVCVNELGKALAQHFPYDPSIPHNELPDEIVFGK
ncbi:TPM domain-containing protein [Polluticoccus soli]|uniref:TPM domain-containing protein n=1 Tax=Polluticoccus soli TaxID=3034150 RepID=UPI0023E2EC6B|nr:TPM domain-containing protein [Flavipsychrobacter sp. JY13-12]